MSKLEDRLTRQLAAKGNKNARGFAIALMTKRGQLRGGELTQEGEERQALGASGRAKSRASAASNSHPPGDYSYNPKTNAAKLKK